jgi:hypothetical protein
MKLRINSALSTNEVGQNIKPKVMAQMRQPAIHVIATWMDQSHTWEIDGTNIVSGHYPWSCFYLKHTTLRRLDSVSVFMWNLLSCAQSIELVRISDTSSNTRWDLWPKQNIHHLRELRQTDGLRCAWLIYPLLCWCWCPEIWTSSIDWAHLSRFHLEEETESSLRNVRFKWKRDDGQCPEKQ